MSSSTTDNAPIPSMNCPSCRGPMKAEKFETHQKGEITLDLCFSCNAIWLDQMESTQLCPGAVIQLFKLIHEHRDDGRKVMADTMNCARCPEPLKLVHDLARGGRLSYHRCPAGHGRLTSFYQFLREKQFVRNLTPVEITALKAKVTQVRCSSCGGPVDLERDTSCGYCRSPISILDAQAVEKALNVLAEKEHKRFSVDPAMLTDAIMETRRPHARALHAEGRVGNTWGQPRAWSDAGDTVDLVADCISVISKIFD